MTHPTGKGIFIWQASSYYIPDVTKEAEKIAAAGFKWAAVQTCDGYMTQWPTTIILLVEALEAVGLKVWSWGMIYAHGPNAEGWGYSEGVVAGHHRRLLELEGHIFDEEAYSKMDRGALGLQQAHIGFYEEDHSAIRGMTSYRYPTAHPSFPWHNALTGVSFVCPQVYWEQSHNPATQLKRCVMEYEKLTHVPLIPIGATYGVPGWEPTVSDVRMFVDEGKTLLLPGYAFWNWRTLTRRPLLLAAIAKME